MTKRVFLGMSSSPSLWIFQDAGMLTFSGGMIGWRSTGLFCLTTLSRTRILPVPVCLLTWTIHCNFPENAAAYNPFVKSKSLSKPDDYLISCSTDHQVRFLPSLSLHSSMVTQGCCFI